MDSSPDQTMQALLGVHRFEVAALEEQLDLAEQNISNTRYVNDRQTEDIKRLKSDVERHRATIKERDERIEKLQGIIDALKLDLGNEREAHTKTREGGE